MIGMSMGHSTGDEGIALAMSICEEGGRSIFHLARFLARREKEQKAAAAAGTDPVISDACSAYRGGHTCSTDPEVKTLLSQLLGKEPFESLSEKPFAFLGDGSDLSYFWKKTPRNTAVMMPRSVIEGIEDPELLTKVTSVFAKARMDGLLAVRGENYFLTETGEKAIHKADFIKNRLQNECRYYGIAFQTLGNEQEKREMDKIDGKLRELGRSEEFQGCDRIVLMKNRLYASEKEDFLRFYLPGTGRKKVVELPKADVISLDEKSFAAFLRPEAKYSVNGDMVEEQGIFRYFWNKNQTESERIFHAEDMGVMDSPTEEWIRNWEEELSRREGLSRGDQCFVLSSKNGETLPRRCTVEEIFPSPDGNDLYRLRPESEDGSKQAAVLLQKEDLGERFFVSETDASQYIAAHPEDAKEVGEILDKNSNTESLTPLELRAKPAYLDMGEKQEPAHIRIGGRNFEQLEIPKSDIQVEKSGSVILRLQPEKTYTVRTGDVSYMVSGKGAEKLLKSTKSLAASTAKKVATETVKAAAVSTATTAAAAGAAAATAGIAAPVSAAAKLIQSTVSEAAKLGGNEQGLSRGLKR